MKKFYKEIKDTKQKQIQKEKQIHKAATSISKKEKKACLYIPKIKVFLKSSIKKIKQYGHRVVDLSQAFFVQTKQQIKKYKKTI